MDIRSILNRKSKPSFLIRAYAVPVDRPNDPDRKWFSFDPVEIYPATINRIYHCLTTGEYPTELIQAGDLRNPTSVAEMYLAEARLIDPQAWKYALIPRSELNEEHVLQARARALELARRWFTQALHVSVGASIGIHILKGDGSFRL
jgi:hypothetical protein